MEDHYNSLFTTSVKELKFANMQRDYLLSILDEIESMTTDKLVKWIITNTRERDNLDRMIHTRQIFGNDKKWFND